MAVEQRRGQQSPNKFDPKLEDRKGTKLVSKRFRQLLRRYHRCTIPCLFIDFGNFNLSLSNRTSEMMIDQIHVPAELSGCEPKLELEIYNQTWIFKPSQGSVNELVAYHLDKIFVFLSFFWKLPFLQ